MPKNVLILCTGNSCRSQLAEVLWNHLANDWLAVSAGSRPAGYVHPLAIKALQDIDLPVTQLVSKHANEFADQEFELVVTVCDHAQETCPVFPGAKATLHWPFFDPADADGSEQEKFAVFCRVRDEIRAKIETFLNAGA